MIQKYNITEKIILNLFTILRYLSRIEIINRFSSNLKIFEHIIDIISFFNNLNIFENKI